MPKIHFTPEEGDKILYFGAFGIITDVGDPGIRHTVMLKNGRRVYLASHEMTWEGEDWFGHWEATGKGT